MEYVQDALNWFDVEGLLNQFDPYNRANLVVYFLSIFVWLYSTMAIWLAKTRRWRFVNILLNQVSAAGVIISWSLFALISYSFWPWALGLAAITLLMATYQFVIRDWRRRRRAERMHRAIEKARQMREEPRLRPRP
jgi:hypothetical protein